jgi:cytidyltransferase-like protein
MKKRAWKYSEKEKLSKSLSGKKIVLVGGCFDLIHYGHLTFLKNAKDQGDVLVVALESDEFIVKSKKRSPIHTQMQRAELLLSHHVVDHILLLPYLKNHVQYRELVETVRPQIIAVTEGDPHLQNKKEFASRINAEVVAVSSLIPRLSTTRILSYETFSRSRAVHGGSSKGDGTN